MPAARVATPALPAGAAPSSEQAAAAPMAVAFGTVRITELAGFPPAPPPAGGCYFYLTLNAEISLAAASSDTLHRLVESPRLRVSVDGQWILWALRRKYAHIEIQKLAGSDLIYRLAEHCHEGGRRLLLLGGAEAPNTEAVRRLRARFPAARIEGFSPPWFDPRSADWHDVRGLIRERIEAVVPDYIVCGLGAPKEQAWALDEADWLEARQVTGVFFFGGAIDFASGHLRRAPLAWQRVGMEGLHRVLQQPRRWRRLLKVLRILAVIASGRY